MEKIDRAIQRSEENSLENVTLEIVSLIHCGFLSS